jgi:hypothetical protein
MAKFILMFTMVVSTSAFANSNNFGALADITLVAGKKSEPIDVKKLDFDLNQVQDPAMLEYLLEQARKDRRLTSDAGLYLKHIADSAAAESFDQTASATPAAAK